ncbi:hypothetical protein AGDE_11311 [Angomonas deanei]|nr:hypothetical protein AGDE_11311 [Angomonas deanei]|eukprot:EPY26451.1 hypothetical protein AGDE_11311 [Angomonas deanei]
MYRGLGRVTLAQEGSLLHSTRGIRTVIPPRPVTTVIAYVSRGGYAIRDREESDVSLIRTRDNKFYLQRVLETGEVIRWRAPGLDYLKNVTNMDTYDLSEINDNGGVIIPADVMSTTPNDPPNVLDALDYIRKVKPTAKLTRKDRRHWHRQLYSHWSESPEKYFSHTVGTYGAAFLFVLWVVVRGFYAIKNDKPFWDVNVYGKTDEERVKTDPWMRLKRFSDNHPEHESFDFRPIMMSPGQAQLSSARAELRESDFTDPHFNSEFWWKVRHMRYYGHWPKGLAE